MSLAEGAVRPVRIPLLNALFKNEQINRMQRKSASYLAAGASSPSVVGRRGKVLQSKMWPHSQQT